MFGTEFKDLNMRESRKILVEQERLIGDRSFENINLDILELAKSKLESPPFYHYFKAVHEMLKRTPIVPLNKN